MVFATIADNAGMMKPLFGRVLLLALFMPRAVFAQVDLGMELSRKQVPKHVRTLCDATPSQNYPCLQNVILDGVRYAVVGYDEQTRRIKYLLTYDESFRTKDGLHVGSVMDWSEDEIWGARGGFVVGPKIGRAHV